MEKKQERHANYFEAIIQLRPPTDEIVSFIINQCKKKGEAITRVEEIPAGIDLYITSQKFARSLGPKLKRVFGGELKITKKVFGQDRLKSKTLYRATVLFRPRQPKSKAL